MNAVAEEKEAGPCPIDAQMASARFGLSRDSASRVLRSIRLHGKRHTREVVGRDKKNVRNA